MNNMSRPYSIAERGLWLAAAALVVFFWRWNSHALDADLAAQAALAYQKFALTAQPVAGNPLSGRLPYLAQWGAWVFRHFGVSESSARLAVDLPMALASLAMLGWMWFRLGWPVALAASLWLRPANADSAYGLAVVATAICAYEVFWHPKIKFWARLPLNLILFGALFLSTAAQGAAGISVWVGGFFSLLLAFLFSERAFWKLMFSFFAYALGFWAALAPFLLNFYGAFQNSGWPAVAMNTFQGAVEHHSTFISGDWSSVQWRPLAAAEDFLRAHAVWVWLVPAMWLVMLGRRKQRPRENFLLAAWTLNGVGFFVAALFAAGFFAPARSLHFLAVLVPLLWPLVGAALVQAWRWAKIPVEVKARLKRPAARWIALALAGLVLGVAPAKKSGDQRFVAAAARIQRLPPQCEVLVPSEEVSDEEMESLGAWYFRGRAWTSREHTLPSAITVPAGQVYWEPSKNILWGQGACKI